MEYKQEKLILNGRIKLITELTEFRMGLWIYGFGLSDAVTNEEIIPLISFFNLDNLEEVNDALKIRFRIYPDGSTYYDVVVNPFLRNLVHRYKQYHTNDFYKIFTGKEYQ